MNYPHIKQNNPILANANENKTQQKSLTYDDILSSMKMVVSSDGILQYITSNKKEILEKSEILDTLETSDMLYKKYHDQEIEEYNKNKIEPEMKNSYIFNKHFKSYKEPGILPTVPRGPLTHREYKILIIKKLIERHNAKLRVSILKPKKINYSTNMNTYTYTHTKTSQLNNHLFNLKL